MGIVAFGGCEGGRGMYRIGVLFLLRSFPLGVVMVWLGIRFPDGVGVGDLVGEVCKLGV